LRFQEIIKQGVADAVDSAGYGMPGLELVLEKPRIKEHGDICTPVALALAKHFKKIKR